MVSVFRHSILLDKVHVRSQRTCCQHAPRGVSRLLVCITFQRALWSPFFPAFSIGGLKPGQKYFGPSSPDDADLCMCSTVGYSLVSACGGCQQGNWVPYDFCHCYLLNSRLIYLPLVGRHSRSTVQVPWLPPSEFLSWQRIYQV